MVPKLGNARLAIPRINQNPRPPRIGQARPAVRSPGIGNRSVARPPVRQAIANAAAIKTPATSTAQPTNAVAAAPTTPVDPLASAAASPTPAAPTGLFDLPAYTPQAGQPDPRDATYWANLAKLKFTDEQEYGKGLQAQQQADTSYGSALQNAIRERGVQERTLGENAIRGNLGNSGWLDRNEAEQTTAYTQDRAQALTAKEQEDQSRNSAQKAILQGFGLDANSLLSEAGGRYAEALREAAQKEEAQLAAQQAAEPAAYAGPTGYAPTGPSTTGQFRPRKPPPVKEAIGNRRRA